MHPSSLFHTDANEVRAIIAHNPLATIAMNGPDGPIVAVVPVVWSEDETRLIGHIGRTNAFWTAAEGTTPSVTAVFRADDAYVSASAYPSKAEHGKVVPTWNYVAAEARGCLSFKTERDDIRASVAALSDQMEADRETPWAITDAPESYINKLSKAIVAFEIEVIALKGVRKLSQNKNETERAGVIADLTSRSGNGAAIAEAMRRDLS